MMLQGISGVTAPHLKDIGFDPGYIALVLSAHSISLTVFKFGVGWIYDRKGLRFTSNVCFIASVVVMLAMAVIANNVTGRALAMICTVGMSLALPLETVMLPIYAADLFGEHSYNKFLGIVSAANTAGFALGAPVANLVFDLTGSYIGAFYGGAALMVIATVVMQFVITAAHKEQKKVEEVGGQAVLGRQHSHTTPWLTERHGYDPTYRRVLRSRGADGDRHSGHAVCDYCGP